MVYNQGTADASQSAAVKAQNNRLLFWSCDANCLQAAGWNGITAGAVDDGSAGLSMVEQGGGLVVEVTNSAKVFALVCGGNCLVATNWSVGEVDSAQLMTASYNPVTFSQATCSGSNPQSASWHLAAGVVALRSDGSAVFAHAVSILRTCPGSTSVAYIPGFGRVVSVP